MKTKDFDYYLPEELIAQTPLEKRDESRLMCLDKETGAISHQHFYELPEFLKPGDCLILNNSRVLPARLLGRRLPGGGACEVLLLIDRGDKTWECIVRPGKHLRKGARMEFGNGELTAEVIDVLPDGNRMVKFDFEGIFLEVLERLGKMPLPPYIKEELADQERYQTVYSEVNGSAALTELTSASSNFYGTHVYTGTLDNGQRIMTVACINGNGAMTGTTADVRVPNDAVKGYDLYLVGSDGTETKLDVSSRSNSNYSVVRVNMQDGAALIRLVPQSNG